MARDDFSLPSSVFQQRKREIKQQRNRQIKEDKYKVKQVDDTYELSLIENNVVLADFYNKDLAYYVCTILNVYGDD